MTLVARLGAWPACTGPPRRPRLDRSTTAESRALRRRRGRLALICQRSNLGNRFGPTSITWAALSHPVPPKSFVPVATLLLPFRAIYVRWPRTGNRMVVKMVETGRSPSGSGGRAGAPARP